MTVTRYSLKALANQQWTSGVSKELVENVSHRLHLQSRACSILLEQLPKPRTSGNSLYQDASKNLRHLLYVHNDTLMQCRQLADHPHVFERWSRADQRLVSALAEEIRSRHAPGIEKWVEYAQFVQRYQGDSSIDDDDEVLVRSILPRRWSVQLLCDQLVKLPRGHNAVAVPCDVASVIRDAHTEAAALCDAHWQRSPDLDLDVVGFDVNATVTSPECAKNVTTTTTSAAGAPLVTAPVVRPWLHHALVELFKNAMHSTLQQWSSSHVEETMPAASPSSLSSSPPPITVRIQASADRFVTIDVVDQGVGLETDDIDGGASARWAFQIGTSSAAASSKWDRLNVQQSYAPVRSPLNSLGVGLPVARMMMRHFGGDVTLRPKPGGPSGCVAQIVLPLDATVREALTCVDIDVE